MVLGVLTAEQKAATETRKKEDLKRQIKNLTRRHESELHQAECTLRDWKTHCKVPESYLHPHVREFQ